MEMLELAAELKWCRERIAALEAERDAFQSDFETAERLLASTIAERDRLRAENARLIAPSSADAKRSAGM